MNHQVKYNWTYFKNLNGDCFVFLKFLHAKCLII